MDEEAGRAGWIGADAPNDDCVGDVQRSSQCVRHGGVVSFAVLCEIRNLLRYVCGMFSFAAPRGWCLKRTAATNGQNGTPKTLMFGCSSRQTKIQSHPENHNHGKPQPRVVTTLAAQVIVTSTVSVLDTMVLTTMAFASGSICRMRHENVVTRRNTS